MVGGGAGGRVKKREKVMCDVVGSAAWVGLRGLHCRNFTDLLLADRLRLLVQLYRVPAIHAYMYTTIHNTIRVLSSYTRLYLVRT